MDIDVPSGRVIGGRCIVVLFEISTVCTEINITLLQRGWVITNVGYSISVIGFVISNVVLSSATSNSP